MLTPPKDLIPHLVFPGVRVSLICISLPVLDTDFGCRFFRLPDFDCGLFCMCDLDTLILITDLVFFFLMGLTAGVTGLQGMPTPPRHPIPPLVYPEVSVCPILRSVFPTGLMRLITVRYLCHFIYTMSMTSSTSFSMLKKSHHIYFFCRAVKFPISPGPNVQWIQTFLRWIQMGSCAGYKRPVWHFTIDMSR
jgi:hypothetical protein